MRFIWNKNGPGPSAYIVSRLILNKALEVGFQRWPGGIGGLDVNWRFRTRGHHAGLNFYVEIPGWLFEFNLHDTRHWDHVTQTWHHHDR